MPSRDQGPGDLRPDESGGTGDEHAQGSEGSAGHVRSPPARAGER
jgi:hypothetical protein